MNFREFAEETAKNVRSCLGGSVKAEMKSVTKNNGVKLHGLQYFSHDLSGWFLQGIQTGKKDGGYRVRDRGHL